jgi:hypothetical protein
MAFDISRPVQWKRLCIEWAVVCVVVGVMMLFSDALRSPGNVLGLVFGFVVYLAFGWTMAKLGYQRQRVRWDRAGHASGTSPTNGVAPSRSRPAPTKRTNGGRGSARQR